MIVDEPMAGLDPEERVRFRNMLGDLASDRVVILSTHIVSDVQAVADDIAILSQGRLLRHDTPEKLLRLAGGRLWEALVGSSDPAEFRGHPVSRAVRTPDGVRARCSPIPCPWPQPSRSPTSRTLTCWWCVRRSIGHRQVGGNGVAARRPEVAS